MVSAKPLHHRLFGKIDSFFNIFGKIKREIFNAEIEKLIEERQEAEKTEIFRFRRNPHFAFGKEIVLEDTKDGVR